MKMAARRLWVSVALCVRRNTLLITAWLKAGAEWHDWEELLALAQQLLDQRPVMPADKTTESDQQFQVRGCFVSNERFEK
jgi:hypothetical protein